MVYIPKRPKVEGGEKAEMANAETRLASQQITKTIRKFLSINCGTTNLRLLNQKSLRDLLLAIQIIKGELSIAEAKVNQYRDIRNQQGRKGRGKKKSADHDPDEKELKEKAILKKMEDRQMRLNIA